MGYDRVSPRAGGSTPSALGKEMGAYQDPYSDFGRLGRPRSGAPFASWWTPACMPKRWSEDEAVAYFLANSRPSAEAAVRSEIRRYFLVWPGQATAYTIGMHEDPRPARRRLKNELGEAFDIRGFHDTLCSAAARASAGSRHPRARLGGESEGGIARALRPTARRGASVSRPATANLAGGRRTSRDVTAMRPVRARWPPRPRSRC
jgi:hypothetical protein